MTQCQLIFKIFVFLFIYYYGSGTSILKGVHFDLSDLKKSTVNGVYNLKNTAIPPMGEIPADRGCGCSVCIVQTAKTLQHPCPVLRFNNNLYEKSKIKPTTSKLLVCCTKTSARVARGAQL